MKAHESSLVGLEQSRLGPYRLMRLLGSGAMGAVYEAIPEQGERVALKVMRENSAASLYQFKREFRALSGVVHRNLVTLYDLTVEAERAYFTMELVEGTGFLQYVHAPGIAWRQRLPRLRSAFTELVEGVSALHDAGKMHRDLKPSNVLVTRQGRVVVLDFGLATPIVHDAPGPHSSDYALAGTLGYLAPELFSNQRRLSPASDWYSVGIILYEALTGKALPVGYAPEISVETTYWHDASPGDRQAAEDLVGVCASLTKSSPGERSTGREVLSRLGQTLPSESSREVVPVRSQAPFVGREGELKRLHEAFASVAERGRPVTVFLRGPSGAGKTTLARRFLQELGNAEGPPVVLASRCYEREVVPFQACDGLVDAVSRYLRELPEHECMGLLPRRARDLARTFPVLDRVDAIRKARGRDRGDDDPSEHERQRRSIRALKELLGRIGDDRPLVAWLDDLQWGDADSAALLTEILAPPDPPALLLLGCYRTEDAERSRMLSAFAEHQKLVVGATASDFQTIDLGPLAAEEAKELARSVLDEDADEQLLERIASEARGHAYFVTALAGHLKQQKRRGMARASPESLAGLVRDQLASLPPTRRSLVELVAVAGQPIEEETLRSALHHLEGPGVETVRAAEQELVALGLLRTVRVRRHSAIETYHDRVRESAIAVIDPERLRRLHFSLAHAFQSGEEDVAERAARHFHAAGCLQEAFGYALAAAERASSEMAFQHAADLYELARSCRRDDVEATLLRKQADALANVGCCAAAAPLYVLAARSAPKGDQFDLERLGVEMYLASGRWNEGVAILRPMVEREGLSFPESHAAASVGIAWERAKLAGRGFGFRGNAPVSTELVQKVDVCMSVAKCMTMFEPLIGGYFLLRALRFSLDAGDPRRLSHTLAFYLAVEAAFGQKTARDQESHWALARDLARRSGDATLIATTAVLEGIALFNCGHWKVAFDLIDPADQALRRLRRGLPWDIAARWSFMRLCLFFAGDLNGFLSLAAAHRQDTKQKGDLLEYASSLHHGAWDFVRRDETQNAREAAGIAMRQYPMPSLQESHEWPGVYFLAHCDLYDGDIGGLCDRLERAWPALKRSGILRSSVWGTFFLLLRAYSMCLSERTVHDFRGTKKLVHRLLRARSPWKVAFGHALEACIVLWQGDSERAVAALRLALDAFEREGLMLYAAGARRRLGELLGGREGARHVERAEAFMQAQGISNPERWSTMCVPLPMRRRGR